MSWKFKFCKLKYLFTISVLLMLISGCYKETLHEEFFLTDVMKNQNPYEEGDTIIFANSHDEILVSVVGKRSNNIIKHMINANYGDYNLFEEEKTSIKADSLIISMRMYYEPHQEPLIDFYVSYTGKSGSFYGHSIPFTSSSPREISIKIHDKWYYNVYYFESYNIPKLYYSTEYGVLRVEFLDGSFLDYIGNS